MPLSSELQELVLGRLAFSESTDAGDHTWCDYVFAALQSDANLRAALDGLAPNRPPSAKARKNPHAPKDSGTDVGDATIEGPGVYVGAITVSGFRGIGPAATLTLTPGPGLTIVNGRNGSGKSSFAEGLELLLTNDNFRWKKPRSKEWRDGWRNLHQARHVSLSAVFIVEGKGPLTVTRVERPRMDEAEAITREREKTAGDAASLAFESDNDQKASEQTLWQKECQ